jgi:hypothetical protein
MDQVVIPRQVRQHHHECQHEAQGPEHRLCLASISKETVYMLDQIEEQHA